MSQTKGFCGHFKASWDNHPSCANCFNCSMQFTCEFCCSWSQSTWSKFEQRHSDKAKMGRKSTKEKEQFAFSARPVKPKKKSAPAEMFGVYDLSDHGGSTIVQQTNNLGGLSSSDDTVPRNTVNYLPEKTGQQSLTKSGEQLCTRPDRVSITRQVHRRRDS